MPESDAFIASARPVIDEADIEAAVRVLRTGMVVQGPEVAAFEAEFGNLVGVRNCVAVNSGTSALHLSMLAMGVGPGDEVIVPSFSFAATANAVRLAGAEPVFADIESDSFNVAAHSVEELVTSRTVAIMPVHLYGLPADMDGLRSVADRHGLALVEDAAQAHGAAWGGRPVGSFGKVGCFSFYPTKNMHSLEGGMVTTDDDALARKLRLLRNQGMETRYDNEIVGANMRMTDVAAAIGRRQLQALPAWNEQRRANAAVLDAQLSGVVTPSASPQARHVYHQYTVRVTAGRDEVQEALRQRGVGTAVYYPTPIHRLKPYLTADGRPTRNTDLQNTDRAAQEVLSLPVYPALAPEELERVVHAVNDVVAQR